MFFRMQTWRCYTNSGMSTATRLEIIKRSALALPRQCISSESIIFDSTWLHIPTELLLRKKCRDALSKQEGAEPCLCPRCLQHSQDPFPQAYTSLWVSFAQPEFTLCTNTFHPCREHCTPSSWDLEPSCFLHKPTDGCLAFLSINNHVCCRETTGTALRVLHDFAKRRSLNHSTLYMEKILTMTWVLHCLNMWLNIPFSLLGLINYYARLLYLKLFSLSIFSRIKTINAHGYNHDPVQLGKNTSSILPRKSEKLPSSSGWPSESPSQQLFIKPRQTWLNTTKSSE